MKEILLPKTKDIKDIEVLSTGVSRIRIFEHHLEFACQAEVVRAHEETGAPTNVLFDEYSYIKRTAISSISYNYSNDGDYYSLEINTPDFAIAVAYPVDLKDDGQSVAKQIFNWSILNNQQHGNERNT